MKKRNGKREDGSVFQEHFVNEDAARAYLESVRWGEEGPACPACGVLGESYRLNRQEKTKEQLLADSRAGKRYRKPLKGVWKCRPCKKQFTVTVGTIFEDSHIPLHKWLFAIHLLTSSKKGMSAHQLMRNLDIKQYKSAWFMAHRIRYALTGEIEPMTGVIEADETYIGGKPRKSTEHAFKTGQRAQDQYTRDDKAAVVSVVQRGGSVRSKHVDRVTADNLKEVISSVASEDAHLITDTGVLRNQTTNQAKHSLVNHSAGECVRREEGFAVTTNTVEGYFSLLKRGVNGVYHHWSKKHLHRYLAEFDYRYNARELTDRERALKVLGGIEGKRLTYRTPDSNPKTENKTS